MLARANSDAAARLRRSKSASTVHKRPTPIAKPIDLDDIRQQALAAATTAFVRAHAQDAIVYATRRSDDFSRSKSNASRKALSSQGNHFPPRGSSFRSMQAPKDEHGKSSQCQSQSSILHTEQSTEQSPRFHPRSSSGESLSVPCELSTQPSPAFVEIVRSSFQKKTVRPSAASSVASQQIRKARSMYYASSIQTGSPIARPPAKYMNRTPPESRSPGLELSPVHPPARTLGRPPLTEPRIPVTIAPGVTLNEARDKYLHEFKQNSVKHKPSMLLAPFKKRQDKAKDKGKSSLSDNHLFAGSRENIAIDVTLHTAPSNLMPQQDLKEKRSISGSLKHRIRRVFRRTSAKPTDLPVQHIKASRQYFDALHLCPSNIGDTSSIPCPDQTTLQRVRGRTSSLEMAHPAYLRSEYRSDSTGSGCSTRSLHSEVNAPHAPASRVTSWGTTATSDTLTQRTINRMAVIHESKDSIGSEVERVSSDTGSRRKSLPLLPLSSFRDPMPLDSLREVSSPIDPKRVFSALMREMGTPKSSKEPSVPTKSASGVEDGVLGSSNAKVQTRKLSSSGSQDFHSSIEADQQPFSMQPVIVSSGQNKTSQIRSFDRTIRSTIRAVTPAGQHLSPDPEPTTVAVDAASAHKFGNGTQSVTKPGTQGSQGGNSITKQLHAPAAYISSAWQVKKRMEKSRDHWKVHIEDPEHIQFPQETHKIYDVTALVRQNRPDPIDSTEQTKRSEPQNYSAVDKDVRTLPLSPKVFRSTSIEMPMSPSIYSRNSDGISINLNDSIISLDGPSQLEKSQNAGPAVALAPQSLRSDVVGTPSPQRKEAAHTSRDWRAWLSHEISTMELSSREDITINEEHGEFAKRFHSDSMRVANTGNEGTTVIKTDCLDVTTSRSVTKTATVTDTSIQANKSGILGEKVKRSMVSAAAVFEEHDLLPKTSSTDDASDASSDITTTSQVHTTPQRGSASFSTKPRMLSTLNLSTSYHASIDTAEQLPRSGQGNSTDTVKCSSRNSLAPRHSVSPNDSVASQKRSKLTKSMPEGDLHSRSSARLATETSQYMAATPLNRGETQIERKENMTPKSLNIHHQSTPSPLKLLPRPKSHQLLSLSKPDCSSPNIGQLDIAMSGINSVKPARSPPATHLGPRIRVVARPVSPEKRVRRPKSALNLEATNSRESPHQTTGFTTASSTPAGVACMRDTSLYTTTSMSSPSPHKEPSPLRLAAASVFTTEPCIRSATPGHRMAESFLKERSSTLKWEGSAGKRKGSKFLVREDTPAFL